MGIAGTRTVLGLGVALLASACSFYMSEPLVPQTRLRAALDAAQVVPPTDSRASGYFEAVYRPSTQVLEYRLNVVGLSGPPTMGHLHGPAAAGESADKVAPINVPFYRFDSSVWDGVTLTAAQAAEVVAGRWYVTVSTLRHPEGEIRGQLLPSR